MSAFGRKPDIAISPLLTSAKCHERKSVAFTICRPEASSAHGDRNLGSLHVPPRDAVEGRPPLQDTLTGGRPPGGKFPTPFWGGLPMIGGNEAKRRYWRVAKLPRRLEKARRHIATMGCRRLASCMGTRVANLEQHEPRDDQEARGVFEVSGSIKWFDPSKGYGFIVPDGDRPDILLHVTCLRRGDFQTAYEGARVVCEAINQSKGLTRFASLSWTNHSDPSITIAAACPCRGRPREQLGTSQSEMVRSGAGFRFLTRGGRSSEIFVHMEDLRRCGVVLKSAKGSDTAVTIGILHGADSTPEQKSRCCQPSALGPRRSSAFVPQPEVRNHVREHSKT